MTIQGDFDKIVDAERFNLTSRTVKGVFWRELTKNRIMKNKKINTKKTDRKYGILAVLGLLVVVAAVGLLARKSCKDFEQSVVGHTQQHLLTIAKTAAQRSEEFIEEHLAVLQVFSRNPSIKKDVYSKLVHGKPDSEYCPVRSFYEEHKRDIDAFTVLDDKGIMLERYPFIADRPGMDHTDKPGVSYVIKEHEPYVSKVFVNNLGKTAISVSTPVFHNEQFVGIVRCMIQLDTIYKRFVEPIRVGKKGYLQIVNDDGIITAHPNPKYIGKDIVAIRKAAFPNYDWSELENIIGKMTKGQEGVGTYYSVRLDADEPKFVKKLTAFTPIKLGHELWSIGVTTDYEEISGPIITHTRNISMTAGLLILVFSAAGLWIYKVQKEKTKLTTKAEFAEELRTTNQQLTTEITERKQAEEELHIQNDNRKNIFESMEDGVCVIDQQYDVHHINPVLIRDFGACDGRKCYEYFHNKADVCPWCKNADVFAGKTIRWEWLFPQNGKTYDLIDTPLKNPDGSISKLEIFRDITERKQAEEEREKLLKVLSAKNAELRSIVYIASHDLRSPLVNVTGFGEELTRDCNTLKELLQEAVFDEEKVKKADSIVNESIPESLYFITASAKKMDMLLDGMLRVSRIGTTGINIDRLDMNKILSHVIETFQFKAKKCGAIITVDELGDCFGDNAMINRIFSNLIDNALKYLDAGRKGKIHVSYRSSGQMNIYCVEDNGIGIDPEYHGKIFEVFHRLDPKDSVGGEGLGLTIVARIIDRNDGAIRVESEAGKGSRFFISLPAANA